MKESLAQKKSADDAVLDQTLRPKTWRDFIGQERIKQNLSVLIQAARNRGESCDHVLFYGPAGLGKTTLAHIVAKEMGSSLTVTSGPAIEKAGDLAAIITNLGEGDVLFIDEAHRMSKAIEEILYPALESRVLHLIIGRGPTARTIDLRLPAFTLVAATTRIGLLSGPLRSRFGVTFRLDFYEIPDIEKIIERSAKLLSAEVSPEAVSMLACASRCTPRVANRLLKRARDFAEISKNPIITKDVVKKTLALLEIDTVGLEVADRAILSTIVHKFSGGPVGIQTLAAATAEEKDAIEDIYEPYLMRLGLIERTAKGRKATRLAYEHLGMKTPRGLFAG